MNVVVISDCIDVAFSEMKFIIKKELQRNDVHFDLIKVSEFSIINAAFLTRLIVDVVPKDTILSVVINPTTKRHARIYGTLRNGVKFFGANTGALTPTISDIGCDSLFEIHDPGFVTFGGKNVHAPNIAKIINNVPFDSMGKPFLMQNLTGLSITDGTVVHIDNFGLIKIKGVPINYAEGQSLRIYQNGKHILDAKFSNRMMNNNDREWILYNGSSMGFPELGTVRYKHGFNDMDIKIGDVITWQEMN